MFQKLCKSFHEELVAASLFFAINHPLNRKGRHHDRDAWQIEAAEFKAELKVLASLPPAPVKLVADFSQIVPYLADGKEMFEDCGPATGLRTFSFVEFNEF